MWQAVLVFFVADPTPREATSASCLVVWKDVDGLDATFAVRTVPSLHSGLWPRRRRGLGKNGVPRSTAGKVLSATAGDGDTL